jgi:hypothetical protein
MTANQETRAHPAKAASGKSRVRAFQTDMHISQSGDTQMAKCQTRYRLFA